MPRTVSAEIEIRAAIDLVRRHFWDMHHHAANPVHAGVAFEVKASTDERCEYEQRTRFLGATLRDTLVNTRMPDGGMLARTTGGPNQGMEARFSFDELAPGVTRVRVEVSLTRGRFVAWLVRRGFARALQEDRRDLEGGNYG